MALKIWSMGTLNGTRSDSASLPLLDSVACLASLWKAEELWFRGLLDCLLSEGIVIAMTSKRKGVDGPIPPF